LSCFRACKPQAPLRTGADLAGFDRDRSRRWLAHWADRELTRLLWENLFAANVHTRC